MYRIIFKSENKVLWILIFMILSSCMSKDKTAEKVFIKNENLDEKMYRPSLHFSPKKNWMNDPNGMFYYKGKYHLYFQHHPYSNVWGPMHWGHAISKDLISWEEQPIALFPDNLGTIFSGSAVVDHNNTSGFGTEINPPIVAIYTNHNVKEANEGSIKFQNQSIAYSLDEGQTWTKYINNPIIKNPGVRDFRDPKVIWYEKDQKWILTLAASQITQFYESKDLKEWNYLSSFGEGIGNHNGVWECPDLFELPVRGTDQTKWVHLVSINPGGPNGGSATQYFIGDFDGKKFVIDHDFETQMKNKHDFWTDFGKDNYAGVTFSNWESDKGGVLLLGWMSNWQYASKVPTNTWKSAMTLGRELELYKTKENFYRLRSILSSNLGDYESMAIEKQGELIKENITLVSKKTIDLSTAKVQIKISGLEDTEYTFEIANSSGDKLVFGYDHKELLFFIDRSQSGKTKFSDKFSKKPSIAPRLVNKQTLDIEFVLDKASIEIFFDEGRTVMTEIFFPNAPMEILNLKTSASNSIIDFFKVQELKINK